MHPFSWTRKAALWALFALSSIVFSLLFLEGALRLVAHFSAPSSPVVERPKGSDTCTLLFIGDSWAEGWDAAPGRGYAPTLVQLLRRTYPELSIGYVNAARSASNSSQAVLQFLKYYAQVRPAIIVAQVFHNNAWNVQDIELANASLALERGSMMESPVTGIAGGNALQHLKIVRLFNIMRLRLLQRQGEAGPLPAGPHTVAFLKLKEGYGDVVAAREYLVAHRDQIPSYDDYYRLILHSFSSDERSAISYLEQRGLWKPSRATSVRRRHFWQRKNQQLFEKQMRALKRICDREGILLILQSYPSLDKDYEAENEIIRAVASTYDIPFVDQYRLFKTSLSTKRWKNLMTATHVNTEGHALMAANLARYIDASGVMERPFHGLRPVSHAGVRGKTDAAGIPPK